MVIIASNKIKGKFQMDKLLEENTPWEDFIRLRLPSNRPGTALIKLLSPSPEAAWKNASEAYKTCDTCLIFVACTLNTKELLP